MYEKEPRLVAVVERQTQRNLLDPSNPMPIVVDARNGKMVRFALILENGPEGVMNVSVAGDASWLQPETRNLTLLGSEKAECIVGVHPDGEGEFANLLFSWEGLTKTITLSVMVQRQCPAASQTSGPASQAGGGNTASTKPPQSDWRERAETLKNYIKGMAPDLFISYSEEQAIFRKGGDLRFSTNDTEALLHKLCSDGGWTRETRLRDSLKAQLIEATKDDGIVDRGELNQAVDFAIKRKMPRKDALELCITLILDNNLKPQKAGFFGGTIIDAYRKQFGL
jgi:hypothetical protein